MSKEINYTPGVIQINQPTISEEESQKKIKEILERNFRSDVITEGSRHGGTSFPMDYSEFFLS